MFLMLLDYLLTYFITYSKGQYLSWEANWLSVSQEIPHILMLQQAYFHKFSIVTLDETETIFINFYRL